MFLKKFFLLLFVHCISDYVCQNEAMAKGKRRFKLTNGYNISGNGSPTWYVWLLAHGIINGGFVYLVTSNIYLGFIETILHIIIDYLKCEKKFGIKTDQSLHCVCKIIYSLF